MLRYHGADEIIYLDISRDDNYGLLVYKIIDSSSKSEVVKNSKKYYRCDF